MCRAKAWHGPLLMVSVCFPPDFPADSSGSYFFFPFFASVMKDICGSVFVLLNIDNHFEHAFTSLQGSMQNIFLQ